MKDLFKNKSISIGKRIFILLSMYFDTSFRPVPVLECHSQPTAIPQQSHTLFQLYTALFVC